MSDPCPTTQPEVGRRIVSRRTFAVTIAALFAATQALALGAAPHEPESGFGHAAGGGGPMGAGGPTGIGHSYATTASQLPEHYALTTVWQETQQDRNLYHPEGIDVGRDGQIVVAERGNHRVSVWSSDGQSAAKWGQRGSDLGEFQSPEDVAVDLDARRVYVADTGNSRVQVLDRSSGAPLAAWTGLGTPRGIAVGPDGRVYIGDAASHLVRVLDGEGKPVATWGGPGNGEGRLDTPLGMSFGPDGNLYVADSGNQRIQWFDAEGQAVGSLNLDNSTGPGGTPTDVGIDESGDMYVAVERGILRFANRGAYTDTALPFREIDDPDCPIPGRCKILIPIPENHEGVRRLAVTPAGGLYYTYSPALRFGDLAFAGSARGFPRLIGDSETGPHWRRTYDPSRIDAAPEPYAAHVLDTSGLVRAYRASGQWYDGMHAFSNGPGIDIAANSTVPQFTGVLTGNQVHISSLRDFEGRAPTPVDVLLPSMMTRRDRVGDEVPDYGWWLTALDLSGGDASFPGTGLMAVLNTGAQQLVVRNRDTLVASVSLNRQTDPFRAFRDVTYDSLGHLWVLARDGGLAHINDRGRKLDEVALTGLGGRSAEAIAVSPSRSSFVLTGDGSILKHDLGGTLLAEWRIARDAGPGSYRDISVDQFGRVLVPDGAADRILVFEPSQAPSPEPGPPPGSGSCVAETDKRAAPDRLLLGETTEVTLELTGRCEPANHALDVVLVIDASCQMGGERLGPVRAAAAALVDEMALDDDRFSIVGFSDELGGSRLLVPLTSDVASVRRAVGSFDLNCAPPFLFPDRRGDGRISDGLRAGRESLYGPLGRDDAGKVLLLISASILDREIVERREYGRWIDGSVPASVTEREHSIWEAWRLWSLSARVYTIGVGTGGVQIGRPPEPTPDLQSTHPPDEGLLASLSSPADGYRFAEPSELTSLLRGLGRDLARRVVFETLIITDRLPPDMLLVPGSISPPADTLPGGDLAWTFTEVGPDGPPTISYRVQPQMVGHRPTNVEAAATYVDAYGNPGSRPFPVPYVDVLAPTPTSSATLESTATSTHTPTATATSSATVTATPTNTDTPPPTRAPEPIFLPVLYRQVCVTRSQPVDVALVVDTSSSMSGAKLKGAVDAAATFIDLLNLPLDHAAVITFDDRANTIQRLTGDGPALKRSLSGITTRVGTRIDLGLWEGIDAVAGPEGRPEADPVLVLLTDGRPMGGSEGSTQTAAAIGHELGVRMYAIGLGDDVDPGLLAQIAGDRARVYLTPNESDLARIYSEVARTIPCR